MSSFPYERAVYEDVPCNLCGNTGDFEIIATRDRDNLETRICLCRRCGLIFISPRMTKEWYDRYYDEEYREQDRMKQKAGIKDPDKQFAAGERFGEALAKLISSHLKPGVIVDVGSGIGGVLSGFKKHRPDLEPIGIEPSAKETAYANSRGIKTYEALFENFKEKIPPAANIMNTRALNHLLDPKEFLLRAHKNLLPDGRLILAVSNFRLSSKKHGRLTLQIDHVYMFTPETLVSMVESAGFEVIFFDDPEKTNIRQQLALKSLSLTNHLKIVAKKIAHPKIPNPISPERATRILNSLSPARIKFYYLRYRIHLFLRKVMMKLRSLL